MKSKRVLLLASLAGIFLGCRNTVPDELEKARAEVRRAGVGSVGQVAPVQLHAAEVALAEAEKAFADSGDSFKTRDLAYVAQRKAQLAEAEASTSIQRAGREQAKKELAEAHASVARNTAQDLHATRAQLSAAEEDGRAKNERLAAEREARTNAELRTAAAENALAKLASVKEEPRGLVITLSGSVLFASNDASLLPAARARLEEVATVLLSTRERYLTIEGHSDSRGSPARNLELSQMRADTVRNYLVDHGYDPDRIQARGLGSSMPIASDDTAEGRANNRRVEIVIIQEPRQTN